jgi:6-phosphofructokinase 1
VAQPLIPLSPALLIPWMGRGGSFLASSREPLLAAEAGRAAFSGVLERENIDSVLLFGGNGTLRHIPPLLHEMGVTCVGIPTTIDGDVSGTERTLGFDSACNFAYAAIDGIRMTAHALPGRIFTLETLGGSSGFLALAVAHGAAAHAVLVPEYSYEAAEVGARLGDIAGREGYALLVHSEGARDSRTLVETLSAAAGIRVRDTRLGHAQRGAPPSHLDRVLAADLAAAAHVALRSGMQTGTLVVRGGAVTLHEGLLDPTPVLPDRALYNQINGLN